MRIASYSDFALRLLMYAAVKHPAYVTITEVSKAYGISKNHLMKITHELALAAISIRERPHGGCASPGPPKRLMWGTSCVSRKRRRWSNALIPQPINA